MLELVRRLSWRELTIIQLPALLAALAIAELFYKFHSFLLEALAFLVTWALLEAALTAIARLIGGARAPAAPEVRK
jgi:hypothetical protein